MLGQVRHAHADVLALLFVVNGLANAVLPAGFTDLGAPSTLYEERHDCFSLTHDCFLHRLRRLAFSIPAGYWLLSWLYEDNEAAACRVIEFLRAEGEHGVLSNVVK